MKGRGLVVGGGVAGVACAIALRRAGWEVTVFEAYEEQLSGSAGAWLTVAVNGLDAFGPLGVREAVMREGFPSEVIEFFSGTGRDLGRLPIGGALEDGTVTHTTSRAALLGVLTRRARELGVRFVFGRRLQSFEQDTSGVRATFEGGAGAECELLLGADGVHSVTRRLLDPHNPAARYTGLTNLGGFVEGGGDLVRPGVYAMVFGSRAFFGYTAAPGGDAWWFANTPSVQERPREVMRAMDWRQHLLELFSDDVGPMRALIERTPDPIVGANQYDVVSVPTWRRGRVLLVGDAAHAASPSSGQGVSMAAEDAVTLGMLLDRGDDLEAALGEFERVRRSRTERVVAYGRRYSSAKTAGPVGRVLRDLMLPVVFRLQARLSGPESLSWLYGHHIEWPAR